MQHAAHDLAYTHVNSLSIQADHPGGGAVQVTSEVTNTVLPNIMTCYADHCMSEHNATERQSANCGHRLCQQASSSLTAVDSHNLFER
jgi:hypothetical protein